MWGPILSGRYRQIPGIPGLSNNKYAKLLQIILIFKKVTRKVY